MFNEGSKRGRVGGGDTDDEKASRGGNDAVEKNSERKSFSAARHFFSQAHTMPKRDCDVV